MNKEHEPKKQTSSKNIIPRHARKVLTPLLAGLALSVSVAQPQEAQAQKQGGYEAKQAEVLPKHHVQRTANKLAGIFVKEYRDVEKQQFPDAFTRVSFYDKARTRANLMLITAAPTLFSEDTVAQYETSVDMGRKNGKLDPNSATRVNSRIQLYSTQTSDDPGITLYESSFTKSKNGHWNTLVTYTGQKGDDFTSGIDTYRNPSFDLEKFDAIGKQSVGIARDQVDARTVGTIFPPNELVRDRVVGPEDFVFNGPTVK